MKKVHIFWTKIPDVALCGAPRNVLTVGDDDSMLCAECETMSAVIFVSSGGHTYPVVQRYKK